MLLQLKTHKEGEKKSKVIKAKLLKSRLFQKAKIVMFYLAFGGEVETEEMIKKARKLGKIVAVPFCRQNRKLMRPCLLAVKPQLTKGPYAVLQPAQERLIGAKDLDLVIVPGLAFDRQGNRLGRGKGCYDYFLKKLSPAARSIGLAYKFQILPRLPVSSRDTKVNKVIFA
jgi:5-formyltetrahydrofolate cyclo-ligase